MASIKSVQVGKPAPDFNCTAVVDGRLKEVTLSSYTQANHWLILIFFPKAFSFICPTEIKAFSARLEEFLYSRSCAVVFASTDSEHCLRAWNATGDMEGGLGGVHVPLISDCNHRLSRDYGVLIQEEGVAQRALFIIDPKGVVRSITVNDADVGRSVDEAQRVLDALKFKDEFGEGCPVDWKKGDAGINTTTPLEGKLELKKSWSEWARPKLQRAWSGTSARSSHGATPSLITLSNVAGNGPASPVPNVSPHHASLTKLNREEFA
ncbi:thioredoxin-like protein, partial [Hortaea werneckii]